MVVDGAFEALGTGHGEGMLCTAGSNRVQLIEADSDNAFSGKWMAAARAIKSKM